MRDPHYHIGYRNAPSRLPSLHDHVKTRESPARERVRPAPEPIEDETLDSFAARLVRERLWNGLLQALERTGRCTVEDGYRNTLPEDWAAFNVAKLGLGTIRRFVRENGLLDLGTTRAERAGRRHSTIHIYGRPTP